HGHNDHTGGLKYLKHLTCDLYCHPDCQDRKTYQGTDVSMPVELSETGMRIHLSKEPVKLTDRLTYLGEIPRKWQQVSPLEDDFLYDDTAIVYEGRKGLFIITGCSHSGIINICQYAMEVTGCRNLYGIIGGFHIQNDEALAEYVAEYLYDRNIAELYPCHCTDLKAKTMLARKCPVTEVGSGLVIEY
ncbi:MAG: MBL fold metallo-hydrolase, partial [Erysipelotrichaceae bacterium]|nr:MBL fold metallo-hydrolase [Erysipelotrichaceae bacterium]